MKTSALRTSTFLCILLVGCVYRESFRPRHAAMEQASELFECNDMQVAAAPVSPFQNDPLLRQTYVVAWGCGQIAQFNCSAFGARAGSCVRDEWYQTPPEGEPQASVKLRVSYRATEGRTQRELIQIDQRPIVHPADSMGRALALPVSAGEHRFEISSAPLITERHIGTSVGYYHVASYTYERTRAAQGCGRAFSLDVEPNATYRVELDYTGANQCALSCAREIQTPAGPALMTCTGFTQ